MGEAMIQWIAEAAPCSAGTSSVTAEKFTELLAGADRGADHANRFAALVRIQEVFALGDEGQALPELNKLLYVGWWLESLHRSRGQVFALMSRHEHRRFPLEEAKEGLE